MAWAPNDPIPTRHGCDAGTDLANQTGFDY